MEEKKGKKGKEEKKESKKNQREKEKDKYIGEWKDDYREGKGNIILIMEVNMMVNGKIINMKEKEYFIGMMEINMMVNGKMIKKKKKE